MAGDERALGLTLTRPQPGLLELCLSGTWRLTQPAPDPDEVRRAIGAARPDRIRFEATGIATWDSTLVAFAAQTLAIGRATGVPVDRDGLPTGVRHLLALAEATPLHATSPECRRASWFARIGTRALLRSDGIAHVLAWIGDLTSAFVRLVTGRARFRPRDLFLQMDLAGAHALGIVSLVSALFGLILAFLGAVQLKRFGATLYTADLVGTVMVREMGAVMAAIVVAGRTGAAFAAELGTMRVTEEIDAFTSLGIPPIEFLVLPRVIAVTLVMPLLCIYADVVGLMGGAIVGIGAIGIPARLYYDETLSALVLDDLVVGVIKATAYGFLVAAAACFEGLRSGTTAAGVGKAATAAVVDGIVLVIAAAGGFAVLFYLLGI